MADNEMRKSITFDIEFDEAQTPRSGVPKRLQEHDARPVTPKDLEEKQKKAEERRKAYEEAKIERIVKLEGEPKKKRTESQ